METHQTHPDAQVALPNGIERHSLAAGGTYLKVHHFADPDKDLEWLSKVRQEMADTPREFEVEILMRELNLDGQPVFAQFEESLHAPVHLEGRRLMPMPFSQFILGWDCGTASVHPAAVLLELTARTSRLQPMARPLLEVVSKPGTSMDAFIPAVLEALSLHYPEIDTSSIHHCGDESGRARQGATGESAFDVLRRHGLWLRPVSNHWQRRRSAVDRFLSGRAADGIPQFLLNRSLCPVLLNGFLGGYRLKQVTSGSSEIYGEPIKDQYSHPHDALQYACVVAWELLEDSGPERFSRRTGRKIVVEDED